MGDHRAQKKGPRKGCVPGGRRTRHFSGSDWTLPYRGIAARFCRLPRRAFSMCPKRAARFRADGHTLRGPQERPVPAVPRCGPIHVDCFVGFLFGWYPPIAGAMFGFA